MRASLTTSWHEAKKRRLKKKQYKNKWPIDPKHRVAGMLACSLWDEDCRFCEILNRYDSATPTIFATMTHAIFLFYAQIPARFVAQMF